MAYWSDAILICYYLINCLSHKILRYKCPMKVLHDRKFTIFHFQIDVILQSLSDAYGQFIMNFHMHKMQYTLAELINMLVTAELSMKDSKGSVLTMERTSSKRKSFEKKKKSAKKQKVDGKKKKTEPKRKAAEKGKYFHCNSYGHWKRNYSQYLATLKNKKDGPSGGS
uniref:Uncharacterized protein LOC105038108 n=1 Tax=Elaeis guineensis var. tenera TaxID=51953 RepID=A0A6I9QMC1_ELAGV|nr:uncharacterized protein LOC105038108 [Elaeis guineensis]